MPKYFLKLFFCCIIFSFFLFFFIFSATAVNYDLEMPILPSQTQAQTPGQFIKTFFTYGLGMVGIVALFAIIIGGAHYILSGGSESKKSEGKRWIWGAIGGLILLLFSYWILRTIHPQFVSLQEPNLNQSISTIGGGEGLEIPLIGGQTGSMPTPGQYIKTFFIFGLGLIGIVALFAIVYGGFVYFLSAGNQAMKTHGKKWIWAAISGLALSLLSFLILYTINPQLIGLNIKGLDKISTGNGGASQSPGSSSEKSKSLVDSELKKLESLPENTEFADLIIPAEYCPSVVQTATMKNRNLLKENLISVFSPIIRPSRGAEATPIPYVPDVDAIPLVTRAYISSTFARNDPEFTGRLAQNLNILKNTLPEEYQHIFESKDKVFLTDEDYQYILSAAISDGSEAAENTDGISCRLGALNSNFINLDKGDYTTVYHETMHDIDLYNATWNKDEQEWEGGLSSTAEFDDLYRRSLEYNSWASIIRATEPEPIEPLPHAGFVSEYAATNRVEFFAELGTFYYLYRGDVSRISDDVPTQRLIQEGFGYLLKVGAVKSSFPQFIQP